MHELEMTQEKKTNVYTLIHKLKSLYYYDHQKKKHWLHNLGSKKEDNEIANYKSIHLDLLYQIAIAT